MKGVIELVAKQRVERLDLKGEVALDRSSETYTRQARLHSARNRHRRNTITRLFETSPAELMAKAHEGQSESLLKRPRSQGSTDTREGRANSDSVMVKRDSAPPRLSTVPDGSPLNEDGGSGLEMGPLDAEQGNDTAVDLPMSIYEGGEPEL